MAEDSASTKLTFFLVGAGIGAVVALLFAPKSGRELRGDIADASKRSVEYTRDNARRLGSKASELYETGREKATHLNEQVKERTSGFIGAGRERVEEQRQRLAAAIDAGKRAYQDKKAEVQALEAALEEAEPEEV